MKKIFLSILGLSISLLAYNGGTYEGNKKGCAEGNAKACNDLAGMYLSGRSHPVRVKEDKDKAKLYYAKSKQLYSKHCDKGDGKACFDLADIYNGMKWNVDQNYTIMLKHFTKSCDNNYGRGCNEVGALYKRGRGTKKDKVKSDSYYAKAVSLYKKECDSNIARSCKQLATIYKLNMYGTNQEASSEALNNKAFHLYEDLCEKKDDEGCFQMASYNYHGILTPINWKKAKAYYEKSCEYGQDSACYKARDIDISKQHVLENRMKKRNLMFKYRMMEEKERKARKERSALQMKEINDPSKTQAEKEATLEKVLAENVIWEKEYKKRIHAIKKAHEDEKKVIESRTN